MEPRLTLGPLLGGVLIATVGLGAAYGLDLLTFTAALYAVLRLPPIRPEGASGRRAGFASVLEGLRFLRGRSRRAHDVPGRHRRDGVRDAAGAVPRGGGVFYGGGAGVAGAAGLGAGDRVR